MRVSVSITKYLEDFWADEETLSSLTDAEIIELIQEDIMAFVEDAEWKVYR